MTSLSASLRGLFWCRPRVLACCHGCGAIHNTTGAEPARDRGGSRDVLTVKTRRDNLPERLPAYGCGECPPQLLHDAWIALTSGDLAEWDRFVALHWDTRQRVTS